MDTYGQEPEIRLLGLLTRHLEHRTMVDVGAERGGMAQKMLDLGIEKVHTIDPHPDNVRVLRTRFKGDTRVKVHEYAASDSDGTGELHVSSTPDGLQLPFGHTLLDRPDTAEIAWKETRSVTRRSLASLISTGEMPTRTGILKIDTEGHDLAVVRGMGPLDADVVMVEHWTDLPNGLGVCPWKPEDMIEALKARGFMRFAFIIHRGEFITLKWNDASVERGAMGNLVFLRERAVDRLLPELLDCASWLGEEAVRVGQMYVEAARDRLALVSELEKTAADRLALIDQLTEHSQGAASTARARAQHTT